MSAQGQHTPDRPPGVPTAPKEGSKIPCGEPMYFGETVVGHCSRLVRWRHRGRERGTHRGPHRIEWWS